METLTGPNVPMDINQDERRSAHRRTAVGLSLFLLVLLSATVSGLEVFSSSGRPTQTPRANRSDQPDGSPTQTGGQDKAEAMQTGLSSAPSAETLGKVSRSLALILGRNEQTEQADASQATDRTSDTTDATTAASDSRQDDGKKPTAQPSGQQMAAAASGSSGSDNTSDPSGSDDASGSGSAAGQQSPSDSGPTDDVPNGEKRETDRKDDFILSSFLQSLLDFWRRLWEIIWSSAKICGSWLRSTLEIRVEE